MKVITDGKIRECGECQACCEVVGVDELGKGTWERCKFQCGTGCSEYEKRPHSCRAYYCAWKLGFIDGAERRPDKLGVVFDLREENGIGYLTAWEVKSGAFAEQAVKYLLGKIGEKARVAMRPR